MPSEPQLPPDELERLVAELDAGDHDDRLPLPSGGATSDVPLQRFADVRPFDVRAWAERKGLRLPPR